MSGWKARTRKSPSKTIRCEQCMAICQRYMDAGGKLPGPQVRWASVTLRRGDERRELCGACHLEFKLTEEGKP